MSASAAEIVRGSVKMFKPDQGFGFITGDDGREYFFHSSQGYETLLDFTRKASRAPQKGDRVVFHVMPPRSPGKNPQAMPWAFEGRNDQSRSDTPRRLLPLASAFAAIPAKPAFEPINTVIERQCDGNFGAMTAFVQIQATFPDAIVRIFCEFALKGEALWLDFKARKGDSDQYGWSDYVTAIIQENFNKLIGPKGCQQASELRILIWMNYLMKQGQPSDADIFGLYLGDPAMLRKYGDACKDCNLSRCRFYPHAQWTERRR